MDIAPLAPVGNAAAQQQKGGGFGWNPLTDLMQVTSKVGSFVDAHTQIGSFNPGLGSFGSMAANMLPGLINTGLQVGKKVVTGQEGEALHQLGEVGVGMLHGFSDTLADVATLGGLAPYTKELTQRWGTLPGHYTPNTLAQYATKPGQGLLGAAFVDAANVAMVADGAGALAKMGEVGKAADAIRAAEVAGKITKADVAGAPLADIAQAGEASRFLKLHDTVDQMMEANPKADPAALRAKLLERINTLDKIDNVRSGAQNIIQPWRALRPFERAASALKAQERAAAAPEAVAGAEPVPGAAEGPKPAEGHTGASEGKPGEAGPKPGWTRIYRGSDAPEVNPEGPPHPTQGDWWTTVKPEGRGGYEHWQYTDIPTTAATRLRESVSQDALNRGEGDTPVVGKDIIMDHNNPAQAKWLDEAKIHDQGEPVSVGAPSHNAVWHGPDGDVPVTVTGVMGTTHEGQTFFSTSEGSGGIPAAEVSFMEGREPEPLPGAMASPEAGGTAEVKQSGIVGFFQGLKNENVPRAYQSYVEVTQPIPRWATNTVAKLPRPLMDVLTWMDAHHTKIDYQRITREQQRAVSYTAKEIENRPEIQAIRQSVIDLVRARHPGITPTVASNLVGQMINAYITHGVDLIEQLEGARTALEEALPGEGSLLVDAQLHYTITLPAELNTPEFRQEMYKLAEPYKQLRLAASESMRNSEFLANKGIPVDQNIPILTKGEMRLSNQAKAKLEKAADLEKGAVQRQLNGLAKEKAWAEDERARAVSAAQMSLENMVEAKTDFDRSRYVPQAVKTPKLLRRAADAIYARVIAKNGATFNPHDGSFIDVAVPPGQGGKIGFLVGALDGSVIKIPVDEFMRINPETNRPIGAEMIEHFIPAYQEAYQFPDMHVGVWLADDGNVHIDPTQFLEGAGRRDEAMVLASVRGQRAFMDVAHGEEIPTIGDPNVSAYFVGTHGARDTVAGGLRETNGKIQDAGGKGMTDDQMDAAMASFDRLAVTQHLLHPDQYKTADDVYKTFRVEYGERASSNAGALNEVRLMLKSPTQIKGILRPLLETAGAESRWYFANHNYIEKLGARLPAIKVGYSSIGNHRTISGTELLYSLIAIQSINASPSEDLAGALAAFRNMNSFQVKKWAKAIREWEATPHTERVTRSGKAVDLPPLLRELLDGSNQVARRQTMAVLDGHTIDTWDAEWVRKTFPEYGNAKGAALPAGKVTAAELKALGTEDAAIMEHFGSAAQAKLRSFWENLKDPENSMSVTLDSHMARAFGHGDTFWNGPNWFKHAQMIRDIARDMSAEYGRKIMPHEVQAALWYWVKTKYASVNTAATRANVLDNMAMIEKGTYTAETDAVHVFNQMLVDEATKPRPEGDLVEPRKMRFVDQPLDAEGKGKTVTRKIPWRREAVGATSKEGLKIMARAEAYKVDVADKIAALDMSTPEGKAQAKALMMKWMTSEETKLRNKTKGENFWDAEKKATVRADGDVLGVTLPGDPTVLNEFRDEIVGQFVPTSRLQGGIIRLFKGADIGTLLHEQGHLLRALTTGDDLKTLERAYGVQNHVWTVKQEEDFVHDFLASASSDVRFVANPEMAHLKEALAQAYGDFGENLHPEIDTFWQKVLAPEIKRVNEPGFTLSTGEKLIGIEGKSELGRTMGQRQQQTPNVSASETIKQTYDRGAKGQEAVDDWRKAQKRMRQGQQAAARAQAHVDKLEKDILTRNVPAATAAAALTRAAANDLDKLYARIDDPTVGRVPPKWQPMVESARSMARLVEQHPELEPILESFPKTFGQAMDYAESVGFDPSYMPALTPAKVRSLIAGTAQLGGQGTNEMGRQFTSGARKQRSNALQRLGGQDQSVEALIAGLNQAVQEERTNMIVDWIDRVVAKDLPTNAVGKRLGAPPGWVEWDQIRKGMLGADTVEGGRVAVGATQMIPKPVADATREYAGQPPTNPIYRGLKMVTDPWRALMLTLNPGFYLKHFQGHIMLAALAGGLDLGAWSEAWKAARSGGASMGAILFKGEGFKNLPQVTSQNIIFNEMGAFNKSGTPGVIGYQSIGDAMTHGGFAAGRHEFFQRAHNVVSATDGFARAVAYFAKKRKGYTDGQAMQYAMDAVIDYGNLSNTERYWVRAIVPFYSFEKGVAKIVFRMPIDHPVAAALMMTMAKLQEEHAVDDNGNPLPERYQGVVDLPLLGPTDMQKFNPLRDVEALITPEGILSSLQFAVQDVVRAAAGLPAPGTKAKVKVDGYGRLVPDVSVTSQLGSSFFGGPQGRFLQTGGVSRFLGIPRVKQDVLNRAGERNTLSLAELANADQATQEKAAAAPINTLALQSNLRHRLDGGAGAAPVVLPQNAGAGEPKITQEELQKAVSDAVAAQKAKAAVTRAAHPRSSSVGTRRRGGSSRTRIRKGYARRSRSVFKIKTVKVGKRSF